MAQLRFILFITMTIIFSGVRADPAASTEMQNGSSGEPVVLCSQRGLIVHLGNGDEYLAEASAGKEPVRIHRLVPSFASCVRIRKALVKQGIHGQVTVGVLSSARLPYADNLVNAFFVSSRCGVSPEEFFRVLAPEGRAFLPKKTGRSLIARMEQAGFRHTAGGAENTGAVGKRSQNKWMVFTKPWPGAMDEWTHYLHDAGGNPVSQDTCIGPPKRLKWRAGPLFGRHHNRVPTVSSMISAAGRIFSILDDAPPGAKHMPARYCLYARDAFNGLLLWRRPLDTWGWPSWSDHPLPASGFSGKRGNGGRFTQPVQLPRTLVAGGGHLFATLGFGGAVSRLDMETGDVECTYRGTENTDEILYSDGMLIVAAHEQPVAEKIAQAKKGRNVKLEKRILSVDASSGKILWTSSAFTGVSGKRGFMDIHRHLNPVLGDGRVFLTGKKWIICLDLQTGGTLWKVKRPAFPERRTRYDLRSTDMVTLVHHKGVVFFAQLEPDRRIGWREIRAALYAYCASDGTLLWKRPCASWGWVTPPDVWIIDELVFVADSMGESFVGLDPDDGAVRRKVSTKTAFDQEHHHRCYRNKATSQYIVTSFHGMELFDVKGRAEASVHPWVRSVCRYGFLPANGLLYNAPDHCGCYAHVKLTGFNALEAGQKASGGYEKKTGRRLLRRAVKVSEPALPDAGENWPAFRHDAQRSGIASCKLPRELTRTWTVPAGGTPTAPVVAGGQVFLAVPEHSLVVSLDAETGRRLWTSPVESRVDTPPTCQGGTVVFGCADGCVYCLRAGDGALIWRFDAAPQKRLIISDGVLESSWPVHGSVVVQDGNVYVTAGRSMYLDGGFAAWILDAATGEVLSGRSIDGDEAEFLGMRLGTHAIPGVKDDVLVSDGASLYMRDTVIFPRTSQREEDGSVQKEKGGLRLSTRAGFLDGSMFNRTSQWKFGTTRLGDYAVANADEAYCWRLYTRRLSGDYGFFQPGAGAREVCAYRVKDEQASKKAMQKRKNKAGSMQLIWKRRFPVIVRSMLKAGEVLCMAGMPDVVPDDDPWRVYEGRGPGIIMLIDAATGKAVSEIPLSSPPVYHGMAAAQKRLFVCAENGDIMCFSGASKTAVKRKR